MSPRRLAGAVLGITLLTAWAFAVGRWSAPTPATPTAKAAAPSGPAAALVDEALARGVWTEADREGLRRLTIGLPRAQATALFTRVTAAVNQGRLRVELARPPII